MRINILLREMLGEIVRNHFNTPTVDHTIRHCIREAVNNSHNTLVLRFIQDLCTSQREKIELKYIQRHLVTHSDHCQHQSIKILVIPDLREGKQSKHGKRMTSVSSTTVMVILLCTGMIDRIFRVSEGEVRPIGDLLIRILTLTAAFDVLEAKWIGLGSESNEGMDSQF